MKRALFPLLILLLLLIAGCSPTANNKSPISTETVEKQSTSSPAFLPTQAERPLQPTERTNGDFATTPAPSQESIPSSEGRLFELEWPAEMNLGESDLIRLSLIPTQDGYIVQTEFAEHNLVTQPAVIEYRSGYSLLVRARLDAVSFNISPSSEQTLALEPGHPITFRWSLMPHRAGQQRLSLNVWFEWHPMDGNTGPITQAQVYTRSLSIQVRSFFGVTRPMAVGTGLFALLLGSGFSITGLLLRRPDRRLQLRQLSPNPAVQLDPGELHLAPEECSLLQALFERYARLLIKIEFLSGYSGARTFLALPIRDDGQSDAATIVKLGGRAAIEREYQAYETYVKDRLPPITARIQHPPVTLPNSRRAAVQYTFIGRPGELPISLRQMLLKDPNPQHLWQLFETFGPNWWLQRQPATFRWGQEYDRVLPAHLILEPFEGRTKPSALLNEQTNPAQLKCAPGDIVEIGSFTQAELRVDGCSWSLTGKTIAGAPPLRLRWMAATLPTHGLARVQATRISLLSQWTNGLNHTNLANPLPQLTSWLNQTVQASRSIIHGDLNLENILVGPGGLMWLIDFSETRLGHPLADFSHLAAEIIVHIYAEQFLSAEDYTQRIQNDSLPLLNTLQAIASRCLLYPSQTSEVQLAFALSCLGALKYPQLSAHARQLLAISAAIYAARL
jgi:hypothetical protein